MQRYGDKNAYSETETQSHATSPKSSPKRMATKKIGSLCRRSPSLSARTFKILASTARKHRNLLSEKHFLRSAFYSAAFQNALAVL
jgi:hypothetical protein